MLSSIFKYFRTSIPLTVTVGFTIGMTGGAEGRASAQADVSVSIDEGVGVSAPLIGVGADAGGGVGNAGIVTAKPTDGINY